MKNLKNLRKKFCEFQPRCFRLEFSYKNWAVTTKTEQYLLRLSFVEEDRGGDKSAREFSLSNIFLTSSEEHIQ
jgi:hypothetical protein